MILARGIDEIENTFDFTDSIVTDVRWVNHLRDLSIRLDYYWDIQEGKRETRELTLVFQHCLKAEFHMPKELFHLPESVRNIDSWFTIVSVKRAESGQQDASGWHRMNIYTFDYKTPWATIVCREVILEQR
ncbi:hypothetical protein RA955_09735 [Geobacillus proteiniphilus]|uniref:Uncharacterized protein n=1 Tax=Geobacillus proteiniphilus TaxID=860353 RepID=A0ABY9MAS5_9BACL|nr:MULTISPECIES: hypothetical protein [Geobacillus]WMJ15132.1 hypothetical protein RA955_09735 [Geobacillus proteiniphilus]